jgi:hypothetical protein
MDHLAQEEYPPGTVFFNGLVTDFYGIFNSVAKSEMAGEIKCYGAKIEYGGGKILLAQVFNAPDLFNPASQGRPVVCGYVKLFNNSILSFLTAKLGRLFCN